MTVTTTDIERLAVKLRAEIDALSACTPTHALRHMSILHAVV